jgi:hypothetical protein
VPLIQPSKLRLEPLDDGKLLHDQGMLVAALRELDSDDTHKIRPTGKLLTRAGTLYRAT